MATITYEERERIRQAGREAARRSAQAQGLPAKVTDPDAIERVAALLRGPNDQQGVH